LDGHTVFAQTFRGWEQVWFEYYAYGGPGPENGGRSDISDIWKNQPKPTNWFLNGQKEQPNKLKKLIL
jgi:hypothetical protein